MTDRYCNCFYKSLKSQSVTTWTSVASFWFSVVLCICGVFLNYKFLKKLEDERKSKPLGRKGNVIEPIMRWFCVTQIIFWPYELGFLWVTFNSIVPIDMVPSWLCHVLSNTMILGHSCITYNSFFVAFIRYIYIVHHKKSNQWNFEKVGRRSQIASIAVPLAITTVILFTLDPNLLGERFSLRDCAASYNSTKIGKPFRPITVDFTMQYLPNQLVDILGISSLIIQVMAHLNIIEVFLYFMIFRQIKRKILNKTLFSFSPSMIFL